MHERRPVLVADPECAVGQLHQPFDVDAAHVLLQGRALTVERRFGRCRAQRIGHAVERHAVAVLQRDDVGDAERAVFEQQHAVYRRRVGWCRIDPAVLDLFAGELGARLFLHIAAGDVRAAVAERPDHVGRIVRMAERAAADADAEIDRLAAREIVGTDPQQRVVAGVDAGGYVGARCCSGQASHHESRQYRKQLPLHDRVPAVAPGLNQRASCDRSVTGRRWPGRGYGGGSRPFVL